MAMNSSAGLAQEIMSRLLAESKRRERDLRRWFWPILISLLTSYLITLCIASLFALPMKHPLAEALFWVLSVGVFIQGPRIWARKRK
jgi:hypothetical protein